MGGHPANRMKVVSRETRLSMRKPWQAKAAADAAVGKKASRYYPAEDVKQKLNNHHNNNKQTKLKKSISAGSVLILLAGRFKGSRVVFLKQLESGLLLVTGPYQINGVPLRRVPQSYVIGTQTTVDISGVKLPKEVNDDLFKKPQSAKKQKKDEDFYEDGAKKPNTIDESRKALQKTVDTAVLASINKTPMLKQYIASRFSLKNGDK